MTDTDRLDYLIATHDNIRKTADGFYVVSPALADFTPKRFDSPRKALDDAILNRWPTHWRNPERLRKESGV